jgi:hypothetical protein
MTIFLFWVIFSILVSVYAGKKGRSGGGFFLLSLLLSPLIGFLIALLVQPRRERIALQAGMKKCQHCAEFVRAEAKICRYCQREILDPPIADPLPAGTPPQASAARAAGPAEHDAGAPAGGVASAANPAPPRRGTLVVASVVVALVLGLILWANLSRPGGVGPQAEPAAGMPGGSAPGLSTTTPSAGPTGNNREAVGFAKAMTDLDRQTWPKAGAIWSLDLTPRQVAGDILGYRRHVTRCVATISMSNEWLRQTESDQRTFLTAALHVLHRPPVFAMEPLDYYPNSTGEVLVKVGGRIVARGTYTATKTTIHLEPGTFAAP